MTTTTTTTTTATHAASVPLSLDKSPASLPPVTR